MRCDVPITIPIRVLDASEQNCGACHHTAVGPVCRAEFGGDCAAPELHGPTDKLRAVLDALAAALGGLGAGATTRVRMLRLADGEAELALAVTSACGGPLAADTAFQTLRRLLPDTDIYVTHALQ